MSEKKVKINHCKFCKKEQKTPLSLGYCTSCYQYFVLHSFNIFPKSGFGRLDRVTDETSNQYGMPICHICGKAYTKLQQHIWYTHKMEKKEYCDIFGLDHGINMTTPEYNKKMSDYAYKYDMDKQVTTAGKSTRYTKGHKRNYKRSYQTKQRLHDQGILIGELYGKKVNKNDSK